MNTPNTSNTPQKGDTAPHFHSVVNGKSIHFKDLVKQKHVILYFYPKDFTPGCTLEAQDFQKHLASIAKLGATVIGVSKDSEESHNKFCAKHHLSFPLIADSSGEVCKAYNVWQEKKMFKKVYMGIVRYTFLIARGGIIEQVWAKVRVKGHVEEVVEALKQLQSS